MATRKTAKKASRTTRKTTRKATPKKAARRAARPQGNAAPPSPLHAITPYLAVSDAGRALDWYKKVFGAKEVTRQQVPGGKIMHGHLRIGDVDLFLADIFPGSDNVDPAKAGASVSLHYYRPNAGHVWERAVAEGAKVTMPFEDQFWGDRYGKIVDPFGHSWSIARKSPLSRKEMDALREKAMAAMSGGAGEMPQ